MKKQIFSRGLLGFPQGIAIGHILTILFSLAIGEGYYLPWDQSLVEMYGSQLNVVMLHTFLCGIIGMSFAASSVVWDIENWSIAKQTGVYFTINSLVITPIAYITNWFEHSIVGFTSFFLVFILTFITTWLVQYTVIRIRINKINAKLK